MLSAMKSEARNLELWERVRPLIPERPPHPKGGCPAADDRQMFADTFLLNFSPLIPFPLLRFCDSELDYMPNVHPASSQLVLQALGMYGISPSGIWGMPSLAQPEKGRAIIMSVVNEIHHQLARLLELLDAQ